MEKELEDRFVKIENELKGINVKLSEIQKTDLEDFNSIDKNIDTLNESLNKISRSIGVLHENIVDSQSNIILAIQGAKDDIISFLKKS